jgi:Kdo2-lipid IVA lauroyltransferase/acyltransferase
VKNDALWILAVAALAVARRLPLPALLRAGRALGLLAHGVAGSARRTALDNVARVLPHLPGDERRALVRACFAELGAFLGESVALLTPGRRAHLPPLTLTADARATLLEAGRGARGVLFASAHLGPWERVAAALVEANVPLTTLARESYDPRFSRLYQTLRRHTGVDVIWRAEPGAAARILRTLRRGGVLGVPMDLRTRVPSRDVSFLGHPAPTAIGPARIALRVGAAVVVGTAAQAEG